MPPRSHVTEGTGAGSGPVGASRAAPPPRPPRPRGGDDGPGRRDRPDRQGLVTAETGSMPTGS